MIQWNLLTMSFDMQYFLDYKYKPRHIETNKNNLLLALYSGKGIDIFSMETGILISSYEG